MLFSHSVSSASMIRYWRVIGSVEGPDGRVSRKARLRPPQRRHAALVRTPTSPEPPARCDPGVRPVDALTQSLRHARLCESRRTAAPCLPPALLPPQQCTSDPLFSPPPAAASVAAPHRVAVPPPRPTPPTSPKTPRHSPP